MTLHLFALFPFCPDHLEAVLLHSLWQGLLISLIVFAALRRAPVSRAQLRYGIAVAGLFGLVLAVLVTWCTLEYLDRPAAPPTEIAVAGSPAATAVADAPAVSAATPVSVARTNHPPVPSISRIVPAQVLLAVWMAGVLVMLVRLFWLLRGTRTLTRRSMEVADPVVCTLMDEMRTALRISRMVAVRAVDGLVSPVALGLFWPVVLLPLSMVTGLTADQLRIVLAHELAHIRRYDYLVNFLQLVVESLLYFNPAVWWLSRQIRIEREACCDALAASVSGGVEQYVVALAEVAGLCLRGAPVPATGQALGDERHPGCLADRVRRLLLPGYWPRLRLRGYSIALGLLLSAALFLGLYQGSRLGVAFAGWCFTDVQRMEAIERIDKDLAANPAANDKHPEDVKVTGRLVLKDGNTLPKEGIYLSCVSKDRNYSCSSSMGVAEGRFECNMTKGEIYVAAMVPGYAPGWVGPFHGDAAHPVENLEIALEASTPAKVRFIDTNHNPVADVAVEGNYQFSFMSGGSVLSWKSGTDGCIQIDQPAGTPLPVSLTASASGFVRASRDNLILRSGTDTDWELKPDEPVHGRVVDKRTGAPIEGAGLVLILEEARNYWRNDTNGKPMVVSDVQGNIELRGLDKTQGYYFAVRCSGYGGEMVHLSPPCEGPIKVELAPRYVRGVIRGDLNLLAHKKPEYARDWLGLLTQQVQSTIRDGLNRMSGTKPAEVPVVTSTMPLQIGDTSHWDRENETPVMEQNGEGTFQIDDLRAGLLRITAGPVTKQIHVAEPIDNLVIDLSAEDQCPKRLLKFSFPVPEGAPAANGSVTVNTYYKETGTAEAEKLVVKDGHGEMKLAVPVRMTVKVDDLTGYVPKRDAKGVDYDPMLMTCDAPEGVDPFTVEVPLERAGAIEGVVLLADGAPAANARVNTRLVYSSGPNQTSTSSLTMMPVQCNAKGEFAFVPAPLGRDIEVTATLDLAARKEHVKLSEWRPVARVELKFAKGIDVSVLVQDPQGRPASNVSVVLSSGSDINTGITTDAAGRCLFRGIDPGQEYQVTARPEALFQQEQAALKVDGSENVLRLKDGLSLEGKAQFTDSGMPAAGVKVSAYLTFESQRALGRIYQVSPVTSDSDGKFRFTNLCPGSFCLGTHSDVTMGLVNGVPTPITGITAEGTEQERTFIAGQAQPVVIQVKRGEVIPSK